MIPKSTAFLILAAAVVVIAGGGLPKAVSAQSSPIKIGVMFPHTGPIAANGMANENGVRLAFEEAGNRVAGRPIELITADDEGKTDVGLTKIQELVERDKVDLLISVVVSPEAGAIAPYIRQAKVPWVTTASLIGLTRSLRDPYVFRMSPASYSYGIVAADWAKKQGWKRIYYIAGNYAPSHEAYDAVEHVYGKSNVISLFPPVGTPDYSPYLSQMDPSKANGTLVAIWGADSPRIARQYAEFGLKSKLPYFGVASFTAEETLNDMPPEIEGTNSGYVYCGTLGTPENKKFVDGYQSQFHLTPGPFAYLAYAGAKAVIAAIETTHGNVSDKARFAAVLSKMQIHGPMGPVSFDQRNGMIGDFFVMKVVKQNGRFQNQCVQRIAQVRDPYNLFP